MTESIETDIEIIWQFQTLQTISLPYKNLQWSFYHIHTLSSSNTTKNNNKITI
jgi:hypothetical protein